MSSDQSLTPTYDLDERSRFDPLSRHVRIPAAQARKQDRYFKVYVQTGGDNRAACEAAGIGTETGRKLLVRSYAKGRLDYWAAQVVREASMSDTDVLAALANIALANVASAYTRGEAVNPRLWPVELRRAVKRIQMVEDEDGAIVGWNFDVVDKTTASQLLTKVKRGYQQANRKPRTVRIALDGKGAAAVEVADAE